MPVIGLLAKSTVDWCEPNYTTTPWVAEYWNTLSSFTLVALSVYPNQSPLLSKVFRFLLGIGSVAFHGTLTYGGQLLDELFMVYYVLYIVHLMFSRKIVSIMAVALGMTYTWHAMPSSTGCMFPEHQFYIFQVFFTLLCVAGLLRSYRLLRRHPDSRRYFVRGTLILAVGYTCWHLDNILCSYLGHVGLHATWHVMAALSLTQFELGIALVKTKT